MEKYIGIKIVKAEPMKKDGKIGYKVVYKDGYLNFVYLCQIEVDCSLIYVYQY